MNIIYNFTFKKPHHTLNHILLNENTTTTIDLNYFKNSTNRFLNSTLTENILNSFIVCNVKSDLFYFYSNI